MASFLPDTSPTFSVPWMNRVDASKKTVVDIRFFYRAVHYEAKKGRRPRGRRKRGKAEGRRERCSRISGLGTKADLNPGLQLGVCFTWSTMQWASLWPSSVIKTGVSLAAHKARYFATLPNLLASPGYPLFPFASSVSSCVLSVCRNRRPLHTRSLACSAACVFFLFVSRFVDSGRSPSATRVVSTLLRSGFSASLAYLGLSSTFRSGVTLCFLSREQRCEVYLNLFPVFLI